MLPHHHLRRQAPPPDAGVAAATPVALPLVVSLNCLEECLLEQDSLAGLAAVEHVGLGRIADGRIESAAAILLHSLAFLPRAAQRRLQPWQLLLCLGSADRAVDSALAADLGLRLVHVDVCRAEEVADSVMALFLGLLRKTHLLSRQTFSASGWLGSVQPLCRGMRRCRGLVLGIVGRSASARSLATKSLAFKLSVLYFDVYEENGKTGHAPIMFPPAARRMDTLNDLLAASDLVSLHCALTNNTIQIINADSLQHIKPRAYIVNTGSSQLIDDCALKQLLIDGTISGCALDGAEGPQWMEAWVKEMPNVLILPRSADYSEEVWMEIREKAISVLQSFFVDGVFPADAVSDEEDGISEIAQDDDDGISEIAQDDDDRSIKKEIESSSNINYANLQKDESQSSTEDHQKHGASNPIGAPVQSQTSGPSKGTPVRSEGKRSRSGKKAKRRQSRRKSEQKSDDQLFERENNCTSQREDENVNGRDQVLSSSSRFASPEDLRSRQTGLGDSAAKSTRANKAMLSMGPVKRSDELLKDGYVIALLASDESGFHVSRQRVRGGGWFLDVMSNVTRKDPAAQFLVVFKDKDTIGLRSFAAGGKLLQINRRMEFVFASHSFDVCESWVVEGSSLDACKLVNSRNPTAILEVQIQILAAVSEEDGVTRWIN